jgi:hypothetical protein
MSYALIEVQYAGTNSDTQVFRISSKEALESRLATLRSNNQVEKILVFTLSSTFTKITSWIKS